MPNTIAARPITGQERDSIQSLRSYVPKLDSVDDSYILRWLRSREGKFDDAADGLKKNMIFRKAWELDEIDGWQSPEILEKYCGYGFLADRDGNPILMSLLGNMDVEGMLRSVESKDYIKFSLAAIEKGLKLCNERSKITGKAFEQMMLIFDLDHITSAHFSSKQFASAFTTLVMLFQEHYPLVLRKILILRAPHLATVAFNSMTPFLSESIQQLIDMPSENDWQNALGQYVDLDAWPRHWGGRIGEDDGRVHSERDCCRCPSKIRYGLGPVPNRYYKDLQSDAFDQLTTVYAGDKHLVEIKAKANSKISWKYMTEEDDIGFAIYFDETNSANELNEMEPVFPYIRLECSKVPLSGNIHCEKTGRYIIEFDNSYSWLCAKQIRYTVNVQEPKRATFDIVQQPHLTAAGLCVSH
uniref:SEC14-like protein 2 n=1 Tax=Panagrolaimus sp. JU765 TaxID=591449 RepID=A0AC34RC78_9BILA